MAIKSQHRTNHKGIQGDGKMVMNIDQFIEWLKQFDKDKDGRISRDELREAIRAKGGWFSTWNSKRGVKAADKNGNGFIDENEIENLADFAQKQLGFRIVPY